MISRREANIYVIDINLQFFKVKCLIELIKNNTQVFTSKSPSLSMGIKVHKWRIKEKSKSTEIIKTVNYEKIKVT